MARVPENILVNLPVHPNLRNDPPLYCTYCGRELEEQKVPSVNWTDILLICPKYREPSWKSMWRDSKHALYYWDSMRTIQNFDPQTGKEIKSGN